MNKIKTDILMSLIASIALGFILSITLIKKLFGEKTGFEECSYVGKYGEKCSDAYHLNSYLPESLIATFVLFVLIFIYLYFFSEGK